MSVVWFSNISRQRSPRPAVHSTTVTCLPERTRKPAERALSISNGCLLPPIPYVPEYCNKTIRDWQGEAGCAGTAGRGDHPPNGASRCSARTEMLTALRPAPAGFPKMIFRSLPHGFAAPATNSSKVEPKHTAARGGLLICEHKQWPEAAACTVG